MFVSRWAVEVFSVCSPYVRGSFWRMSAVCQPTIRNMSAVYSPYVRRIFAICPPYLIYHYPEKLVYFFIIVKICTPW